MKATRIREAVFYLLLLCISPTLSFSQSLNLIPESFSIGSKGAVNFSSLDDELPFWLHNQQYGVIDQSSANALFYGIGKTQLLKTNFYSLEAGAELVLRGSSNSSLFFNLGYLDFTFGGFKLTAGRFYDPLAIKEHGLSTGSFIVSRNASPMPKIALQTNNFIAVPGTQGIVNYSAYFGHGWFTGERFTDNVYLHQKYFYLNLKYLFFDGTGGIVHYVQWGGENELYGSLVKDFSTFLDVVLARGATNEDAPVFDQTNTAGNSIGAYDFNLGLRFDLVDLDIYRVFYLEDKVSTGFRSGWDGIWGLVIKPKNSKILEAFLYEHINTKRQDSYEFEPYGTATYYNHGIYRSGWTHQGRILGNSLILTDGSIDLPIYNNIVIAHHIGIMGDFKSGFEYKFLYTYSRNYGEYNDQIIEVIEPGRPIIAFLRPLDELRKLNHSFLLEANRTLPKNEKIAVGLSLALDIGELYTDRLGMGITFNYDLY